ncbi:MAG: hypothetical protein ABH851_02020 [Methanobacteriota archaeon]
MKWKVFSIFLVIVLAVGYYLDFWGLTEPCRPKTVVKTLPMYINRTVIQEVPVEKIVYVNQTVYVNNCSCPTEPAVTTTTTIPATFYRLSEGESIVHEDFNISFLEGGEKSDVGLYKNQCDLVRFAKFSLSKDGKSVTDLMLRFIDCLEPVDQSDCIATDIACDKIQLGNLTLTFMDVFPEEESQVALFKVKTTT